MTVAPATVVKGFSMIPAYLIKLNAWKAEYMIFFQTYENDMPSINPIAPELHLWETFWKNFTGDLPKTINETLKIVHPMQETFPNMYCSLRLLATIPVTSCECERAVSVLRRLKTYLRNRMVEERLNGLSLMTIHRDIVLDYEEILTRFAIQNPRRLELVNILDDNEFLKK